MGGEQYAVLVYGPKIQMSFTEWCLELNLVNKKEWVENFLKNEKHDYDPYTDSDTESYIEEGNDIIFQQEFDDYNEGHELLSTFLKEFDLSIVFDNNVCWDSCYIGYIVDEYNSFDYKLKEQIDEFCNKYSLDKPTFFASIVGEFE